MKARNFARLIYRLLLRLHPSAFRKRFGDEMLWIFDLSASNGQTAYLLWDGIRSALVQQSRLDPREDRASFLCLEVQTSHLTLARVGQAIVLSGALLLLVASLIVRVMPPISVFNQETTCHSAAELKQSMRLEIRR